MPRRLGCISCISPVAQPGRIAVQRAMYHVLAGLQIVCLERTPEDEVLIIATDGLWDVFACTVSALEAQPASRAGTAVQPFHIMWAADRVVPFPAGTTISRRGICILAWL